jgi:zinc/manganese transport system permease protein
MFSSFMVNTWEVATIVAVVAGVVGFFTVLRGTAFAAHALPNGAFAGAAGAALIGANPLLGMATFSLLGATTIGALGRRARQDVATALAIVMMLGLGALFLSMTSEYAPQIYALLFGQLLGVDSDQLITTAVLGAVCLVATMALFRPLLLASALPEQAAARGIRASSMDFAFLLVIALVTTMAVPVVGALLIFTLLISPAAAAGSFTSRPATAIVASVILSLAILWSSIALAFVYDLPIGFFVGALGAAAYASGRAWARWGRRGGLSTEGSPR